MREDVARDLVAARTDRERVERLDAMCALVLAENEHQNLISRTSADAIWVRHVLDSIQLLDHAGPTAGRWIDVGTGGGFPGLVIAVARPQPIVLVEPRRRRADFLRSAVDALGLTNVVVEDRRIEGVAMTAAIISARAVASVENLLQAAKHCATPQTRWLLPRGRIEPAELAALQRRHENRVFHVEQSVSDPGSSILIVTGRNALR